MSPKLRNLETFSPVRPTKYCFSFIFHNLWKGAKGFEVSKFRALFLTLAGTHKPLAVGVGAGHGEGSAKCLVRGRLKKASNLRTRIFWPFLGLGGKE